jgi:diguanylate cyclase (GGDEF)-like protein
MQTASGVDTQLYPNPDNAPAPEPAERTVDSGTEHLAISELTAAAETFNAAFNTALYELETSRRLLMERSARIAELDESITALNAALQKQIDESRGRDDAHGAEVQALNHTLGGLECERDGLRQQISEQQHAIETQAGELAALNARVSELSASLEQHDAESRRAAKAQASEVHALKQIVRELESERDGLRQQADDRQQSVEAQAGELAELNARMSELNAELERRELENRQAAGAAAALQQEHDAVREQLARVQAELELRTGELTEAASRIDTLGAEINVLTEAGQHRETTHRQESERLQAERDSLNAELQTKEEQLQQNAGELEARTAEIASLGVIQGELTTHVEKLENLNRALHDSSASEKEMHRKVIAEKDAAIAALKARLEATKRSPNNAAGEGEGRLKAAVQELEVRLQESEEQALVYAERAEAADALAAQVERLQRELQAYREGGDAPDAPAPMQNPDAGINPHTDRDRFVARLNKLVAEHSDDGPRHTLMYVLLDNFMRVRDEIGVMHTTQVIDETCAIIESCCSEDDLIAQFGDCTFAVLCSGGSAEEAQRKAERIRTTLENHIFEIAGRTLVTSTSIGICAVRGGDTDAAQVISRADLACESARLSGGNQVVMRSAVSDTLSLPGNNNRHADVVDKVLAENRIKLYYQPISNLKENAINCFEVLTRVIDENSDIILPGEFFTMAVNTGRAEAVDRHVIEGVLKQLAEKPNPDIKLFIKLTRQAVSSDELPQWIANRLDEYRINAGQLVFEIPEQVMASDLKSLSRLSRELNTLGCRIAIEHYRLETQPQHLHHIHPEYLKIDSELVQNITRKGDGLARVNEIMDLARMNNFVTIAEGVETPACLAILWELGVGLAQGYLISEPTGQVSSETSNVDGGYEEEHGSKAVFRIS